MRFAKALAKLIRNIKSKTKNVLMTWDPLLVLS